jgi:hypothetical protein
MTCSGLTTVSLAIRARASDGTLFWVVASRRITPQIG